MALPDEAEQLAAIQRRAWQEDLPPEVSAPMLSEASLDAAAEIWRRAIVRPPLAECRVLVAVDGTNGRVTGFAATMPAQDPDADEATDGEVAEFVVDPVSRRRGHGSRLVNAAVDTLRADGYRLARIWVRSTDDVLRGFLSASGWAADGAHRELGDTEAGNRLKQVRLHTAIG
nr:GNAT family N-acetyltransferase [Naumannella cuiyingiana]